MPATIDSLSINITASAKGANRALNNLTKNLQSLGKALGGVNTSKMQSLANSVKTMGDASKAGSAGMKNLAKAANSTTNNMNKTVASVKLFSSHTTTLASRMKGLQTHTFSLARTFGLLYANLFLVIRAYKKLEEYIESSMDYVETYNYFSVTLDKIGKEFSYMYDRFGYEDAETYAESFSTRLNELTNKMTGYAVGENGESILTTDKNLGLDLNTVMNFQAKTAAITNSVGLVGEASVITSEALTMLASDLSSFTNQDIDTVMTNLTSGLVGQSRALYKYGIDITSTTLETYALANGISKAVSEMTQAEKMQLRELAILQQSKVAWGDQANTLNSVANQYRMFTQATANLGRTIGNLFLPMVQKALPYVNGLVIALNRLFTNLGLNLWGESWLTELMDGISSGYSDAGAEALEEYSDDLTNAAEAAEEYKNQLLGFDEINKLQPIDESSSSGDATGVIDLTEQLQLALADYKKVWNEAFDNAENLAQQYAEAIYNGFQTSPLDLGTSIASWINGKVEKSDWTEIGNTIGEKISYIPTMLAGVAINLEWDDLGTRLGEAFEGITDAIPWETVGKGLGSAFSGIFKTGGAFFKKVDWNGVGDNISSFLNNAISEIQPDDLSDAANAIMDALVNVTVTVASKTNWSKLASKIAESLEKLDWGNVLKIAGVVIGGALIKCIFSGIGAAFSGFISKIVALFTGGGAAGAAGASGSAGGLSGAFATIGGHLGTILLGGVIGSILGFNLAEVTEGTTFSEFMDSVSSLFEMTGEEAAHVLMETLFEGIINILTGGWLNELFISILQEITGQDFSFLNWRSLYDAIFVDNGNTAIESFINSIRDPKSVIENWASGFSTNLASTLSKNVNEKVKTSGANVTKEFATGVSSATAMNTLSSKLGTIPSEVENKLKQAAGTGSTQGQKVLNNLAGSSGLGNAAGLRAVSTSASGVASTITGAIGTIDDKKNSTEVTQNALWNYSDGLYWSSGLGRLDRAVGGVTGKFSGITAATDKQSWTEKAKNVLTGLYEGLQNGTLLNKVSSGIGGLAQRVGTVFASLLGIHSPSTVFADYGRFIDLGLANGIEGNLGYVSSATASLGSVTKDFGVSLPSLSGNASYTVSTSTSGGFLEQIAGAVALAMQSANITINPSYEVKVGNEKLTGVVVKEINRQTVSAGRSPILI